MYSIMIVEDEYLVRQGIASLVDYEQFGMQVIAQAENGREAWQKFQENPADRHQHATDERPRTGQASQGPGS